MSDLRTKKLLTSSIIMLIMLIALILFAICSGEIKVPPLTSLEIIFQHLGIKNNLEIDKIYDYTVWNIRLPRILLAILVGMALSLGGGILQGVVSNPLADAGVIGVSSGSAVGACTAIYLASTNKFFNKFFSNSWIQILFAFLFGLITVMVVVIISRKVSYNSAIIMILTGIAINAFAGGIIAFLTNKSDNISREQMVFWQMGSLSQASWKQVGMLMLICLFGFICTVNIGKKIDLLALGDSQAQQLGVNTTKFRSNCLILVAFLTAGAVSFSGLILFIGLIVPHIMRLIVGTKNQILLPIATLAGGIFLLLSDTICRSTIAGTELPIGMLTSLIGGPVFLYLVIRMAKRNY